MDTGCITLHSMHRRRMEKRALHACLHNPKELFWDAVWIRPGDVITEVIPHTATLGNDLYVNAAEWFSSHLSMNMEAQVKFG